MKFSTFLVATMAILGAVSAADQPLVKTPADALEKIEAAVLPAGVTLMGTAEKIDPPADAVVTDPKEVGVTNDDDKDDKDDDKKEQLGWLGWGVGGLGGWGAGGWGLGGWGSWGGWGGFGPYRFGFMCGGVPGWAYPLGYWNRYGAGLYGGGCGLGMAYGGLYYC